MDCVKCSYTYTKLLTEMKDDIINYIKFLQKHGVIKTQLRCPKCGQLCRELNNDFVFRCNRSRVINGSSTRCNFKQSMKINTCLMGSRLPLKTTCQFICMWLVVRHPRHDFMISELGIAPATAIDWSVFCLEICIEALMMRGDSIIGGEGEVVEIDQAKVEKGKYNKGRWVPGSWMFGAFEKEKKGSFFVNVSDCTADILIDIILQRIAPGSIIMSERWQGDERLLSHPKYETVTGKHNIKFVDPGTGARTKNVEKSWRNVHSNLPTHGRKESNMAGYFAEYCWKRKYERQERLHYFLLEMSRQYNKNEE